MKHYSVTATKGAGAAQARRAEAHRQAGVLAQRARHWDKAAHQFQRAADLTPADWLMWLNLGRARMALGQHAQALEATQRAFELDRANVAVCMLAAELQAAMGAREAHLRTLQSLSADAQPDHDYYNALGWALSQLHQPAAAVEAYFKALALKLDSAQVHYRLGLSFKDLRMAQEAVECFRTATMLGDEQTRVLALGYLVHEARQACNWSESAADTRALLDVIDRDDPVLARWIAPFSLLAIDATPQQQLSVGRRHTLETSSSIVPLPAPGPRRPGRIRVGYLSADFHRHATAVLMTELLERRDTSRFETFLYSHSRDDDDLITRRIRGACEHFVDVLNLGHDEVARRMRADGIDILIDLKGHTRDNRIELMAYRPAPVQATYLGFPATTGASFIDYFIGDRIVTPLEHAAHYSEHIAQLDGCYQPNDGQRTLPPCPPRAALGLPADAVVLCCFNQTYKISPRMLDLWARILVAAPRTVLWMLIWSPHAQANLLRELAERGVGAERVFFAPRLSLQEHIARLRSADLFLDTWPCNAHTTASEALWAGVPVLTVPGETFASRVAASLVTACGLGELACRSEDDYVELATALANEPETLSGIKAHLEVNRRTLPLFDSERLARDMDALLIRMHERHLAGLPPQALPAAAA